MPALSSNASGQGPEKAVSGRDGRDYDTRSDAQIAADREAKGAGNGQRLNLSTVAARNDYDNLGNSFLDTLGNLIAGIFGFSEINPDSYAPSTPGSADWGFDPIGMGLGLAGSAVGIPGLGTAYGALGDLTGGATSDYGKINLGPRVFGGGGAAPSTPAGAGAVDRPSGSVQTSNTPQREAERGTIRGPRQPAPAGNTLLDVFKTGFGQRLPASDLARAFTGVG